MDELTIGDKTYISSKKAAQITGYAKDYVGQLCREGHVEAKMVGRNWYVLEASIRAHRFGAETKEESTKQDSVSEEPGVTPWEPQRYVSEPLVPMPSLARPEPLAIEEVVAAAAEPQISAESASETLTDMQSAWKEWFARKQEALETPEIESPEVIDAREAAHAADIANEYGPAEETEASVPAVEEESQEEAEEVPIAITRQQPAYEKITYLEGELEEEEASVSIHREPTPQIASVAPQAPVTAAPRFIDDVIPVAPSREHYSHAMYEPAPSMPAAAPRVSYIHEEPRQAPKARMMPQPKAKKQGSAANVIVRSVLIIVIIATVIITVIGTGYGDKFNSREGLQYKAIHFLNGTSVYTSNK